MGFFKNDQGKVIWIQDNTDDGFGFWRAIMAIMAIIFIIMLPIYMFGSILGWFLERFWLTTIVLMIINIVISIFLSFKFQYKSYKEQIMEIFIKLLMWTTVINNFMLVAIPSYHNEDIGFGIMDLIIYNIGSLCVIRLLNRLHKNTKISLILAILYYIIWSWIGGLQLHNVCTIENFMEIYNLETKLPLQILYWIYFI